MTTDVLHCVTVDYGSVFEYMKDWEAFIHQHPDYPLIAITYEDLKEVMYPVQCFPIVMLLPGVTLSHDRDHIVTWYCRHALVLLLVMSFS